MIYHLLIGADCNSWQGMLHVVAYLSDRVSEQQSDSD